MVRVLFEERDAEAILRLQPPRENELDRVIWHESSNGQYSVKGAYRKACEMREGGGDLIAEGEWRKLWRLNIPPKMRHLLWRAARGVIPTRHALNRRGIVVEDVCGLCNVDGEDTKHLFLTCEVARSCWRVANAEELVTGAVVEDNDWCRWCMETIRTASEDKITCMAAVVWGLWKERNDRVWNQKSKPEEVIVRMAQEAIDEWRGAAQHRRGGPRQVPSSCTRWHKPPPTFFKVNCDAATFVERNLFGIGIVIRDENGELHGYRMEVMQGCPPVKEYLSQKRH
ncbi:Putative ribonuclease H protein At1g65750 [Linum perenne]